MRVLEHSRWVNAVAYAADGRTLFVGDDGAVHAWNLETGEQALLLQRGRNGKPVRSLATSADGRWLAANCRGLILCRVGTFPTSSDPFPSALAGDGSPRRIRIAPGWTAADFPEMNGELDFSPDAKFIAGTDGERILFRELETAKLASTLARRNLRLSAPTFSADGETLATLSQDGWWGKYRLVLWDFKRREPREELVGGWSGPALFSPGGRWLAVVDDAVVAVYELGSGKVLRTGELPIPTRGWDQVMAFSPDGKHLLIGTREIGAQLWDVESRRLLAAWSWGVGVAACVAFAPDGMTAAVGGARQVIVWDLDLSI